jgi:hypothetical protein
MRQMAKNLLLPLLERLLVIRLFLEMVLHVANNFMIQLSKKWQNTSNRPWIKGMRKLIESKYNMIIIFVFIQPNKFLET